MRPRDSRVIGFATLPQLRTHCRPSRRRLYTTSGRKLIIAEVPFTGGMDMSRLLISSTIAAMFLVVSASGANAQRWYNQSTGPGGGLSTRPGGGLSTGPGGGLSTGPG